MNNPKNPDHWNLLASKLGTEQDLPDPDAETGNAAGEDDNLHGDTPDSTFPPLETPAAASPIAESATPAAEGERDALQVDEQPEASLFSDVEQPPPPKQPPAPRASSSASPAPPKKTVSPNSHWGDLAETLGLPRFEPEEEEYQFESGVEAESAEGQATGEREIERALPEESLESAAEDARISEQPPAAPVEYVASVSEVVEGARSSGSDKPEEEVLGEDDTDLEVELLFSDDDDTQQRPPRRRRRRRRGEEDQADQEGEETRSDEVQELARSEEDEEVIQAQSVEQEQEESTGDEAMPGRRRRRRRRRRSKREAGEEESLGDATAKIAEAEEEAEEEADEKSEEEDTVRESAKGSGERTGRGGRRGKKKRAKREAAEDSDSDDESSDGDPRSKHRKIPTWQEAMKLIIDANLNSRSKSSDGARRRRRR